MNEELRTRYREVFHALDLALGGATYAIRATSTDDQWQTRQMLEDLCKDYALPVRAQYSKTVSLEITVKPAD